MRKVENLMANQEHRRRFKSEKARKYALAKRITLLALGLALAIATAPTIFLATLSLPDFWLLALTAVTFFGCYGLTLLVLKDSMVLLLLNKLFFTVKKLLRKGKAQ